MTRTYKEAKELWKKIKAELSDRSMYDEGALDDELSAEIDYIITSMIWKYA